jgi:DNA repair protein RadC
MNQKIHKGHRQRVKERYLSEGLDGFQDHEVLEFLLFYCIPMKDTNELAHKMISEFGTLAGLFEANPMEISQRCGVSENTAILLSAVTSFARRYDKAKRGLKPVLDSSSKAGEYVRSLFIGSTYEALYVICLDSQSRLNHAKLVHEGTINEVTVYPRLVVETALRHKANSVILAHNHPGGTLNPSNADIEMTKRVMIALEAISISVMDHIIVAGDQYVSFAEKGLLE